MEYEGHSLRHIKMLSAFFTDPNLFWLLYNLFFNPVSWTKRCAHPQVGSTVCALTRPVSRPCNTFALPPSILLSYLTHPNSLPSPLLPIPAQWISLPTCRLIYLHCHFIDSAHHLIPALLRWKGVRGGNYFHFINPVSSIQDLAVWWPVMFSYLPCSLFLIPIVPC